MTDLNSVTPTTQTFTFDVEPSSGDLSGTVIAFSAFGEDTPTTFNLPVEAEGNIGDLSGTVIAFNETSGEGSFDFAFDIIG